MRKVLHLHQSSWEEWDGSCHHQPGHNVANRGHSDSSQTSQEQSSPMNQNIMHYLHSQCFSVVPFVFDDDLLCVYDLGAHISWWTVRQKHSRRRTEKRPTYRREKKMAVWVSPGTEHENRERTKFLAACFDLTAVHTTLNDNVAQVFDVLPNFPLTE